MRSTYDRTGGNRSVDASHFLYQLSDEFNVTLDVEGPGVLYFARYNHWHGSPWHYEVDGVDHIVEETSTADPNHPLRDSVFLPESLFPKHLTWTWSITKGADLMWVPIMFEDRFRMAYTRTRYGTGYYIYHQFLPGIPMSRPLRSWDGKTPPAGDVVDLMKRAGSELVPQVETAAGKKMELQGKTGFVDVPAGGLVKLVELSAGPAMLRAMELSIPEEQAEACEGAWLRMTWDDREHPSVECPVPLFFGAGTLYNRTGREFLVRALPVHIRFADGRIHLGCYLPMPYFRSAKIELVAPSNVGLTDVQWNFRWTPYRGPANHVSYFHATYQDHPRPVPGEDLVLLDTTKVEGGGDWSGQFVGTSFIFSHNGNLGTLEGDPRFFFDDSDSPQAYGTGTEEWGGGGDYWGGQTMTLPLAGHSTGAPRPEDSHHKRDLIQSAYRYLLADLMPFGRNARLQLEHGADNLSREHYETLSYWYGLPAASLVKTDSFQVGDAGSEATHDYESPLASEPTKLTSRYEWGPDTVLLSNGKRKQIYPPHDDIGRTTTGTSDFTLKLRSDNIGVMLRRKLDYQYPNQRAEVYVQDCQSDEWKFAGKWYLAGSNTCVHSNPPEELGATRREVITSNRRFRDDEFLLPRSLTKGKDTIRVRVKFTPVKMPLFPGHPIAELAWSEIRYDAYCYVMPDFGVPKR